MDDRLDEILRRLEALERKVDELTGDRGPRRDSDPAAGREVVCSFRADERRIVDLIVSLVAERLGAGPHDHYHHGHHPGPPPPPHHGPHHHGPHHHHGPGCGHGCHRW